MSKTNNKSITKSVSTKPKLFYLQIPNDNPQLSPEPTLHYGLATSHLEQEINNLETIEQLADIEEKNNTVRAMSFAIMAVIDKLKDIHEHFTETNILIKPWPDGKRGAK